MNISTPCCWDCYGIATWRMKHSRKPSINIPLTSTLKPALACHKGNVRCALEQVYQLVSIRCLHNFNACLQTGGNDVKSRQPVGKRFFVWGQETHEKLIHHVVEHYLSLEPIQLNTSTRIVGFLDWDRQKAKHNAEAPRGVAIVVIFP